MLKNKKKSTIMPKSPPMYDKVSSNFWNDRVKVYTPGAFLKYMFATVFVGIDDDMG